MFAGGSRSFSFLLVGADPDSELRSALEQGAGLSLETSPTGETHGDTATETDCLLVSSGPGEDDIVDIVQRWTTEQPTTPVVVLGERDDEESVGDVLSVGATAWLPRGLAETAPSVLGERLRTTVEREHAQTSAREIYDNVGASPFSTIRTRARCSTQTRHSVNYLATIGPK